MAKKKGYFTPVIDKYLASWILSGTWYTNQDIDDNFYRFVYAIHHFSKPILFEKIPFDDPSIAHISKRVRQKHTKVFTRNPRTSDKQNFIDKITLAIERNHPGFSKEYEHFLVNSLADKAMIMLDGLYFTKICGFPDGRIQASNLQLK